MAKKRMLSWLIAASLTLSLLPTAALAADDSLGSQWAETVAGTIYEHSEGKVATDALTGDGTEENPGLTSSVNTAVSGAVGTITRDEDGKATSVEKVDEIVSNATNQTDGDVNDSAQKVIDTAVNTANNTTIANAVKPGEVHYERVETTVKEDGTTEETKTTVTETVKSEDVKAYVDTKSGEISLAATNAANAAGDAAIAATNAANALSGLGDNPTQQQKDAAQAAAETARTQAETALSTARQNADTATNAYNAAQAAYDKALADYAAAVGGVIDSQLANETVSQSADLGGTVNTAFNTANAAAQGNLDAAIGYQRNADGTIKTDSNGNPLLAESDKTSALAKLAAAQAALKTAEQAKKDAAAQADKAAAYAKDAAVLAEVAKEAAESGTGFMENINATKALRDGIDQALTDSITSKKDEDGNPMTIKKAEEKTSELASVETQLPVARSAADTTQKNETARQKDYDDAVIRYNNAVADEAKKQAAYDAAESTANKAAEKVSRLENEKRTIESENRDLRSQNTNLEWSISKWNLVNRVTDPAEVARIEAQIQNNEETIEKNQNRYSEIGTLVSGELGAAQSDKNKADSAVIGAGSDLIAAKGLTSATNTSMKAQESALNDAKSLNTAAQNNVKNLEAQQRTLREVYGDAIDMLAISKDVQSKGIEVLFGDRDSAATLASAITRRAAAAQAAAENARNATKDYEDALKAVQAAQAQVTTLALTQANAASVREARVAAEAKLKAANEALIQAKLAKDAAVGDAEEAAGKLQEITEVIADISGIEIPSIPGTTPDTTTDDDDTAAAIEDAIVPLAGLIDRQTLVSSLYTHEGSPDGVDAEGTYTLALAWAVAKDVVDEEDDPEEVVTVAILRDVMSRYVKLLNRTFTVEIPGEDDDIVMNCDEILTAFFAG